MFHYCSNIVVWDDYIRTVMERSFSCLHAPDTRIYGTSEGTFLFQYLPEKKLKQKKKKQNWKINQNNNITFKRLSSFLSNIEQNRNLNKKIRTEIKTTNISFKQLSSSFPNHPKYFSGDYTSQWLARIILFNEILCCLIEILKLNKRLNKFYLFCKYWKGKIRSRLNDIFLFQFLFCIY